MEIKRLTLENITEDFLDTLRNLTDLGGLTLNRAKEILQKINQNPCYNIYVLEENNKIVGCTTLLIEQKFIHNAGLVGHIEDVATRKGYEGKGIGSKLIKHAINEAKLAGCYKIILDCSEHNTSFYEKFGFKKHEVCMRLNL